MRSNQYKSVVIWLSILWLPYSAFSQETNPPKVDELVFAQGYGGEINDVHVINVEWFYWDPRNPRYRGRFQVLHPFRGMPEAFLRLYGGGHNRSTYLSAGDVTGDGTEEIVVTFGPITKDCTYPNIVYVRDPRNARIVAHPFQAFPSSNPNTDINYTVGELRTAIGDFIRSGQKQIAIAQGYGSKGYVRLFQYTGLAAPYGWKVVGQFRGMGDEDNPAYTANRNGGITLAAGDLDEDGVDELVVGQTGSDTSTSSFQILDLDETRGQGVAHVSRRIDGIAFPGFFQASGGMELTVADLDGNGQKEIVAASGGNKGNSRDWRDFMSTGIISVLCPTVENRQVTGFRRPKMNPIMYLHNPPSGALHITAGEFDGKNNGEEIAIGHGCLYSYQNQVVTPIKPAFNALFRIYRIDLNSSEEFPDITSFYGVDGRERLQERNWGQPAYLNSLIPTSGEVSLVGIDYE